MRDGGVILKEFIFFGIFFFGMGLVCLWLALCVLCIGGWVVAHIGGGILIRPLGRGFFTRTTSRPSIDSSAVPSDSASEGEIEDHDVQGLTWRDPTLWLFLLFFWPMFLVAMLEQHFSNNYHLGILIVLAACSALMLLVSALVVVL